MQLRPRSIAPSILGLALVLAAGCTDESPVAPVVDESLDPDLTFLHGGFGRRTGNVYLMSNAAGPNEVLVFERASDGTLSASEPVATGGEGTGAGLGNQGAVTLTDDGRWLLVVNPGSDDVSLFRVTRHGLELSDRVPSGGSTPISVTTHRNIVYVLNAGMPNSISGFWIGFNGKLYPISGTTRTLSGDMVGPAQVGFSPDGRALVVTEKATNQITTFRVRFGFWPGEANSQPSVGQTPFGFAFNNRGILVVSEAAGGAPDASTASSYRIRWDGSLQTLDGAVPLTESAACWVAIPRNGRFAYTTNTGSGSVTGLSVERWGDLELLDDDGVTGITGDGSSPIDAAFSRSGQYLYVLSSGTSMLNVFERDGDGALTSVESLELPATANGMAAQ